MPYLSLGQVDLGEDEEAQEWYQGDAFNWGKLAETGLQAVQTVGPGLVKAYVPPATQQAISRGAGYVPEQYRPFFSPFDMGPAQPDRVMVAPQSAVQKALPWLGLVLGAVLIGGRLLR